MTKIEVVPHNPDWSEEFRVESRRIASALGDTVAAVRHIGSTAIPAIHAKPVIDMLVEVRDLAAVDNQSPAMETLGYQVMGEFGIPGRRYFRKDDQNGVRTHQVHIFQHGSEQVTRHLAFRDYLIAHPEDALEYSDLKRDLAAAHPHDSNAYMDGKDAFIKDIDGRAAEWLSGGRTE